MLISHVHRQTDTETETKTHRQRQTDRMGPLLRASASDGSLINWPRMFCDPCTLHLQRPIHTRRHLWHSWSSEFDFPSLHCWPPFEENSNFIISNHKPIQFYN